MLVVQYVHVMLSMAYGGYIEQTVEILLFFFNS